MSCLVRKSGKVNVTTCYLGSIPDLHDHKYTLTERYAVGWDFPTVPFYWPSSWYGKWPYIDPLPALSLCTFHTSGSHSWKHRIQKKCCLKLTINNTVRILACKCLRQAFSLLCIKLKNKNDKTGGGFLGIAIPKRWRWVRFVSFWMAIQTQRHIWQNYK